MLREDFEAPLNEHFNPRIVKLASSPFMHGPCQDAVCQSLQHLVQINNAGMGFPELFAALYTNANLFQRRLEKKSSGNGDSASSSSSSSEKSEGSIKQEAQSIAYSVAGMCLAASADVLEQTVATFANDISTPADGDELAERRKHLALLCIGNLGQHMDLAASGALEALSLDDKVITCFESPTSDTQTGAAFALGNLSVGNMAKYLPLLLQQMGGKKGEGRREGRSEGRSEGRRERRGGREESGGSERVEKKFHRPF